MKAKRVATGILIGCLFLSGCGTPELNVISESSDAAEPSEQVTSSDNKTTSENTSPAKQAQASSGGEASADSSASSESVSAAASSELVQEGDEASASEGTKIDPPEIGGLTYESEMKLDYATGFQVFYYSGGYKYISVPLGGTYLVVPEGGEAPDQLPEKDTQVIYQPLSQIYLAATGAMSFFDALDAMDVVTMTGTNKQGWYIDAPKEALDAGTLKFAGRYSEPDYEMLVDNNCDLAIESTMIFHAPEVEEMIEDLDIPVFVDRSSYELTAFGRIEWIKIYGALLNKEDAAETFFESQEKVLEDMDDYEQTGKTVCFFSMNTAGQVVVRKTEDFIPNMIKLAGGEYIFKDLKNPGSNSASVDLSMEEFYHDCVDADYLVYNATIEDPIEHVSDLIEKNELFAEFKAVQNDNVWQVDSKWYQSTATVGNLITDFHIMLTDGDQSQLSFMSKVPE